MNLDTCPREHLQHYTDKYLLRRLLADSPLNLPRVFLYALYFTLMPAAILGPVLGVVGTAVLAGVAAYLWLWGTPVALDSFLWFWLVWSMVDLALFLLFRLVMGIWEFCQRRVYLEAAADGAAPDLRPGGRLELEFNQGESQSRELVLQVPARGVYVLRASVTDPDKRVEMSFDSLRTCLEEHEQVPGLVNCCRAAYRLGPGCHRVIIRVQSDTASTISISLRSR